MCSFSIHKWSFCDNQALKQLPREQVQLATKFGLIISKGFQFHVKGTPEYVRKCCEESLKRLDVDYIDLYYPHRIDTTVPIEETVSIQSLSMFLPVVMYMLSRGN